LPISHNLLATGRLLSPFGLKGALKVKSFSGEVEHFAALVGLVVQLKAKGRPDLPLKVVGSDVKGVTPLLIFDGYSSPEKAKLLTGYDVYVDRQQSAPLASNEYYLADLMGAQLVYKGQSLGVVCGYIEAATLLLEVKLLAGKNVYIPFTNYFIGKIGSKGQVIELLNDETLLF
jgi:16S rRNA processing protein RimM